MKTSVVATMALLCTAGCSEVLGMTASSSCSPAATAVTLDIVRDELRRLAAESDEGAPALSRSKIRATVSELKLSIDDIRTTKDDPNSTKQFCTGRLKLVLPADMRADADQTREMLGLPGIRELADTANVEANANAFNADIDFNVQPTDEGDRIYAELESGDQAIAFFAELVASHLLKSAVADAKAEQDRIAAEQQAAEAAAAQEAWNAALEQAKAENKMAIQQINAIWSAIPTDVQSSLREVQRAWVRQKDASCRLEAASNASSEQEIALGRLRCDTREQTSRAGQLQRYAYQSIRESYSYAEPM